MFEYIAAVTRKMSNILNATENLGTQGGRAALMCLHEKKRLVQLVQACAPSELVLEDPGMSCRYGFGCILILIFLDRPTETKGLYVRHGWYKYWEDEKTTRRSVCHGGSAVFVPVSIRHFRRLLGTCTSASGR